MLGVGLINTWEESVLNSRRNALIVSAFAWMAVNMPLFLMLSKYDLESSLTAIVYAPNQFLFLFVFFPVAVYLLYSAGQSLGNLVEDKVKKYWLIAASWIFSMLMGSLIAISDISGNDPLDIYQLIPDVAKNTVVATQVVSKELSKIEYKVKKGWPKAEAFSIAERAKKLDPITDFSSARIDQSTSAEEAFRYLLEVGKSRKHQDDLRMIDEALLYSNIVELIVAMIVLMHLVFWVFVSFYGKVRLHWGIERLKSPATSLAITIAFLMIFSISSAFNFGVKDVFFEGIEGSARGDITSAVGTLVLGSILTIVFLRENWLETAKFVYPALMSVVALVFVTAWFSTAFSILTDANNFAILVVTLLASLLIIVSTLLLSLYSPKMYNETRGLVTKTVRVTKK